MATGCFTATIHGRLEALFDFRVRNVRASIYLYYGTFPNELIRPPRSYNIIDAIIVHTRLVKNRRV